MPEENRVRDGRGCEFDLYFGISKLRLTLLMQFDVQYYEILDILLRRDNVDTDDMLLP